MDREPLSGLQPCVRVLLRPSDPHLPRLRRRTRLRARDRRQGQRARGSAGRAARGRRGRASTSRWGRTPTPTSGSRAATGSCRASGRRCATARNPCSVLTKSPLLLRDLPLLREIAAVTDISANLIDPDAGGEGMARHRAAHAQPACADGGGGRAQPRRHPDRSSCRAAHAGHQRRPAQVRGHPRGGRRGRGDEHRRDRRCTCAARCARCSWSWLAAAAPRPRRAVRGALRARGLPAARPSASVSVGCCAASGRGRWRHSGAIRPTRGPSTARRVRRAARSGVRDRKIGPLRPAPCRRRCSDRCPGRPRPSGPLGKPRFITRSRSRCSPCAGTR